ncbi:hypothetical protein Tco_1180772, partial [Tanacetum coccineum]
LNLMAKRQIRNDKRFRYHFGCGKLKITSLCFVDDLLMLCHGDMFSSSILRHGLDEFSMSSGLYPSEAKSEAFFSGLTPKVTDEIKVLVKVVQNKVNDWRNKCLSFAVYDTIDKIIKNFLWTKGGNATGKVSVCWKDVCKPKSQGGLGLKPLHDLNKALMAKHLWSIASNKDSIWVKWVKIYKLRGNNLWDVELKKGQSWVWLQLLNLRDKIRRFVNVKIGDGKDCSFWFDKWHSNGPLNKLINHRIILDVGLSLNAKIDKKGRERNFKVSEVWKAIRTDSPKVIWSENESHSHLFFSCAYSKRLWERLKPMAMMDNMSNIWPSVISSIVNKPANNTIWSVIQRLVFGVAIYLLWLERNSRIYNQVDRTVDGIFEQVVSNVRLKLMGLVLKNSPDVLRAAEIWDLPIDKSGYYDKMVSELFNDMYDD